MPDTATTQAPLEYMTGFDRVIRPQHGWVALNLKELWRYRELFLFLAWRDILVRYKQTYLGVTWAILQPVLTTAIFVLLGRAANFPTDGAPRTVFVFAALLPWQLFSHALTESSNSLVASARIISKVFFPRLIVPASAVLSGTLDFLIGMVILAILMLLYHVQLSWHLLLLPLFFAQCFLTAFAVGVWLSALNVKYRDVRHIVPFFTRIGLFVSPVWFNVTQVKPKWLPDLVYYTLNPMAGVLESFRWSVLGTGFKPHWSGLWAGLAVTLVLLITGLIHFRRTEKTFADII